MKLFLLAVLLLSNLIWALQRLWERETMKLFLLAVLLLSNLIWALQYRSLWYDAAQAEGLAQEAKSVCGK